GRAGGGRFGQSPGHAADLHGHPPGDGQGLLRPDQGGYEPGGPGVPAGAQLLVGQLPAAFGGVVDHRYGVGQPPIGVDPGPLDGDAGTGLAENVGQPSQRFGGDGNEVRIG